MQLKEVLQKAMRTPMDLRGSKDEPSSSHKLKPSNYKLATQEQEQHYYNNNAMNSNNVPDYTTKAKAKRALEKAKQSTHHAPKPSRTEIYDYEPPCIHNPNNAKAVPRGSHVGHFHTPSLIDAWKQLDNIY